MMIYIAGPITAPTLLGIERNCWSALRVATEMIARGYEVFCPHWTGLVTQAWTDPRLTHDRWLETDMVWLHLCDSILLLPGWRDSKGACMEYEAACKAGLAICEWRDGEVAPLHPEQENKCPTMTTTSKKTRARSLVAKTVSSSSPSNPASPAPTAPSTDHSLNWS